MILKQDSILHFLPIEIEKRQFLILDAIRFSLEIIDNSYNSLKNELLNHSEHEIRKDLPQLFNYITIIIDNSVKVINLYKKIGIKKHDSLLNKLNYIKYFRHTFQHIDERIDEYLLNGLLPIHGILMWNYSNPITKKVEVFILSSGIAKYELQYKIVKTDFNEKNKIHSIVFDYVTKKNKKFKREQLDISNLFLELEKIFSIIENDLIIFFNEHKLKRTDWKSRKDILIRLL